MKLQRRTQVIPAAPQAVDNTTLQQARGIVDDVRARGEIAVREHAERLGDVKPGGALVLGPEVAQAALDALAPEERGVLERTANRISAFAQAQRAALDDLDIAVPGGRAGIRYTPVDRAGCYAPGGRYPLPSSVLMTALTAQAAGVSEVWLASPRPAPATLAAAALCDVKGILAVGGAQAIAAMATGAVVPRCDAIVGPGNRWVTAAKQLFSGDVTIDMLAGPSELVVVADETADADRVAADLLAQAEHDPDARVVLLATDDGIADRVDKALTEQLETLPTAEVARQSLQHGFCMVTDLDGAVDACNTLAPEHLALHVADAQELHPRLRHFGALFLGEHAAEALGDYGAGPNHTLPTGGTARSVGALNVLTFLRAQTWLRIDDPAAAQQVVSDAAALGRMEGLEAHARSADRRRS